MDEEVANLIGKSRELSEMFESFKKLAEPNIPEEEEPSVPELVPKVDSLPFKLNFGQSWPVKEYEFRIQAIAFIEQFYEEHNTLPNFEDFQEHFQNLPTSAEMWSEMLESLQGPLEARGLPCYELPNPTLLEPQFVLAVNLLCDPLDSRVPAAKLKEAGLTTKKFKNLLKQEKYLTYYNNAVDQIFDKRLRVERKRVLSQLVMNGDLQAIKHYDEVTGIYRPQREQNYNELMFSMLSSLMEILAKHVPSDVLKKVAIEFQERDIIDVSATSAGQLPVGN